MWSAESLQGLDEKGEEEAAAPGQEGAQGRGAGLGNGGGWVAGRAERRVSCRNQGKEMVGRGQDEEPESRPRAQ